MRVMIEILRGPGAGRTWQGALQHAPCGLIEEDLRRVAGEQLLVRERFALRGVRFTVLCTYCTRPIDRDRLHVSGDGSVHRACYLGREHCRCGAITGVACEWRGFRSEMALIEWLPKSSRGGARDVSPAERLLVAPGCLKAILQATPEEERWMSICATPAGGTCVRRVQWLICADRDGLDVIEPLTGERLRLRGVAYVFASAPPRYAGLTAISGVPIGVHYPVAVDELEPEDAAVVAELPEAERVIGSLVGYVTEAQLDLWIKAGRLAKSRD